mmetsp:Transcript_116992/g.335646  ORF Transcript_116992/g.335646 Transcript_116992/m.335646 type:complete len:240 (-) Transcript_116992:1999-2718(-)
MAARLSKASCPSHRHARRSRRLLGKSNPVALQYAGGQIEPRVALEHAGGEVELVKPVPVDGAEPVVACLDVSALLEVRLQAVADDHPLDEAARLHEAVQLAVEVSEMAARLRQVPLHERRRRLVPEGQQHLVPLLANPALQHCETIPDVGHHRQASGLQDAKDRRVVRHENHGIVDQRRDARRPLGELLHQLPEELQAPVRRRPEDAGEKALRQEAVVAAHQHRGALEQQVDCGAVVVG